MNLSVQLWELNITAINKAVLRMVKKLLHLSFQFLKLIQVHLVQEAEESTA